MGRSGSARSGLIAVSSRVVPARDATVEHLRQHRGGEGQLVDPGEVERDHHRVPQQRDVPELTPDAAGSCGCRGGSLDRHIGRRPIGFDRSERLESGLHSDGAIERAARLGTALAIGLAEFVEGVVDHGRPRADDLARRARGRAERRQLSCRGGIGRPAAGQSQSGEGNGNGLGQCTGHHKDPPGGAVVSIARGNRRAGHLPDRAVRAWSPRDQRTAAIDSRTRSRSAAGSTMRPSSAKAAWVASSTRYVTQSFSSAVTSGCIPAEHNT